MEGGREEAHDGAADDLEEEECAFCKFMKAGPCGKIFKVWRLAPALFFRPCSELIEYDTALRMEGDSC